MTGSNPMTGAKPCILAIDDTPENLLTLKAALGSEFRLQFATSGAMGLALAEAAPPDLILLDVMMPEMDGYETCRRLKAEPRLRSIPVIFVTALDDSEAEGAGLALGAADYITKPINLEIARQRIRNLLERERLRKEVEDHRDHLEQLVQVRTAELRSLAMELLAAEARERHEIAGDLHDDLGQNLAVVKLKLSSLTLPQEDEGSGECGGYRLELKEIEAMIDRFVQSLRSLSTQLSPPVLALYGLGPALQWLAEEMECTYGLCVRVHLGEVASLDETTSSALYRIVRELLINIWKHADVSEAEVTLSTDAASGRLEVRVADAGVGFEVAQAMKPSAKHSYGLFSIKQRIEFIGGALCVDSQADKGTTVSLSLAAAPGPVVKSRLEGDEK